MLIQIEQLIVFTVPYLNPVTVNHIYKTCYYTGADGASHRGKQLIPEAKAFRDAVAIFAQGRTVAPLTNSERKKTRYSVRIDVYLGPHARGDFDNYWKNGLDALVHCGMIHSDACVDGETSKCVVHKNERDDPRTTYTVERL